MARTLDKIKTVWALGPSNVTRVAAYRIGLRTGMHPVLKISADIPVGPFFDGREAPPKSCVARTDWRDTMPYFTAHHFPLDTGAKPDWFANPFTPGARGVDTGDWHSIPDFNTQVGDIKTVWEASRFDWAIAFAQRAAQGGAEDLERLNDWITDWITRNPPYKGTNWKCGQEASLRVLHLAASAVLLGRMEKPTQGLRDLVTLHLRRIAPTIGYAIGQANNHGTSEAAALFVGGSWLGGAEGNAWARMGRRWLENRAQALIEPDGTFCQYSVIYHRLMLETYSFAEVWRRTRALPPFSSILHDRLRSATHWLHAMTCAESGRAPNLGANDGARILALTDSDYGDMRPTLQLASALFCGARAIDEAGKWDQPLHWLGVPRPDGTLPAPQSISFDDGGFHVLHMGIAKAVLRYPRFHFRPSHADALHVDLWHDGRNLLRDAGTYSYAADDMAWAAGTSAHNTATFDTRDQMPRLGRFLFGGWLKATSVTPVHQAQEGTEAAAGYRDTFGANHQRHLRLTRSQLHVKDTLSGTANTAVLRWRVPKGEWHLTSDGISGEGLEIKVTSDASLNMKLVESWESLHYLEKSPVHVLEVSCTVPAQLETEIAF